MYPEMQWPIAGKYPITFSFGESPVWYLKAFGYPHNGIDIGCPIGTPVLSCYNGIVIFADDIPDADGKGIILQHEWGISLYWHLSNLFATMGELVKKIDKIALSGNTGYVTGPHLHFATKIKGVEISGMRGWCDPLKYLQSQQPQVISYPTVGRLYKVQSGETLWAISEKYYGNGLQWKRIYDANREKINNPNIIFPGQELLVP